MVEGRFAGVDWASEEHAVCVVDETGRIVDGRRFKHTETGLRALCARLMQLQVRAGCDRASGRAVDRAAVGRGAHGYRGASEPSPGRRAALQRRAREVRRL
jgi:hypothetical protein